MTDVAAPEVGSAAPEAGTTDGGNPSASEPVEAAPQEPVADDTPKYKIKVGGEEQEVTLEELQSGYQRQSDYTRKTQEIAAMRKRLAQAEALATALERDPKRTLQALNREFGLEGEPSVGEDDWEQMTPEERRLATLEAQLEQTQAQAARRQIEDEFKALEAEFGEVDRDEVANYALKNNVSVPAAYRLMTWEDLRKGQEKLSKELEVLNSKRGAQAVHTGASAAAKAVTPAKPKIDTVRGAYLAALKQVQGQS